MSTKYPVRIMCGDDTEVFMEERYVAVRRYIGGAVVELIAVDGAGAELRLRNTSVIGTPSKAWCEMRLRDTDARRWLLWLLDVDCPLPLQEKAMEYVERAYRRSGVEASDGEG